MEINSCFSFLAQPSSTSSRTRLLLREKLVTRLTKLTFSKLCHIVFLQFSCFHLEKNYQTKTTPAIFILPNDLHSILPWEIKFGKKYSSSCSKRLAHSTNWRFKNLFNQLGAVWLAFKILCELYRCQCRLILKYWDCVYTIDKVWLHPLCTWCPPPTRSWGGKCRFSFCSSSQSAVIQLEGFTSQHDPPCMLLLHMSSSLYMT